MVDIRKIIIIFVVAVLFSVLVFAIIGAIYPMPKYEDYCIRKNYAYATPVEKLAPGESCTDISTPQARADCDKQHGYLEATAYDSKGCPTQQECNTCQYLFDKEMEKYQLYVFYISAVLSLVAIFVGMYLPAQANTLNEWIGTGFMLGGTFALFFGTASSYNSLDRFTKPVVIFLELALVIFIAYRKIANLRDDKKKLGENKRAKKKRR